MRVIFVHTGYADYLELAIRQVLSSNPGCEVILLGDEKNRCLSHLARHYFLRNFQTRALAFREQYVHLSTNSIQFERFCFERWLVLAEFVRMTDLQGSFFMMDSDVLVYADLLDLEKHDLSDTDFTICRQWGPQFTYFRSPDICARLADWIFSIYGDRGQPYLQMTKVFDEYKKAGNQFGGISDMWALQEFSRKLGPRALDLGELSDRPYFDENFSQSYGFILGRDGKSIVWKERIPHYTLQENASLVRVGGIHFQGSAKTVMRRHYTGSLFLSSPYFIARTRHYVKKAMRLFGIKRTSKFNN